MQEDSIGENNGFNNHWISAFQIDCFLHPLKDSYLFDTGAGGVVRRAVTGGIKTRLGEVKKVQEQHEEEVEYDPEVLALRKEAAMKLDLRDRLERSPRRRVGQTRFKLK